MRDLVIDDLQIDKTQTPGSVRLDWQGSSRLRTPGELMSFLDGVVRDVLAHKAAIELHFEQIAYLNSTTMVAVIRFIKEICDKNISIRISYDPRSRLQRMFVDTLRLFDTKDGLFLLQPV